MEDINKLEYNKFYLKTRYYNDEEYKNKQIEKSKLYYINNREKILNKEKNDSEEFKQRRIIHNKKYYLKRKEEKKAREDAEKKAKEDAENDDITFNPGKLLDPDMDYLYIHYKAPNSNRSIVTVFIVDENFFKKYLFPVDIRIDEIYYIGSKINIVVNTDDIINELELEYNIYARY